MRSSFRVDLPTIGLLFSAGLSAWAQTAETSAVIFEPKVLPVLEQNCVKCHSGEGAQGKLDVRTRASLLRGGSKGPAVIPGDSSNSPLYQRVARGEMPLGGKPLSEAERDLIKQWIDQGAKAESPDTTAAAIGTSARDRSHWAFQPPRRPAVPQVANRGRVRNPIDAFLLAELEKRGLRFSPDADRVRLIRRATFDLTGLPPTPEEVADFLKDTSVLAYEKVIDRLLSSPRYGERWGRHW